MSHVLCRRCLCAAGVILGLVLSAFGSVQAFNLDSLLVQSVGGTGAVERLRSLRSYYSAGSVTVAGQPGRFELQYAFPDRVRSDLTLGPLTMVEGYDGAIAWTRDQNGAVSDISGYQKQEVMKAVWMQSYAFLFPNRHPGGMEYLGLAERDGKSYHLVAFHPFDEDTIRVFIDPATALPALSIDRTDNLESVSRFDDYRSIEGVLEPFHVTTVLAQAGVTMEYRVERVTYDSALAASDFDKPTDAIADYRFPGACDSLSIEFVTRGGHIYVPVMINGRKKCRFILDSGASSNVIDAAIAADLSLAEVGKLPVRGVGGYEDASLVRTDSLAIGELVLVGQVAGMVDMSSLGISPMGEEPFGGILGYDFLSRFPVLVDYQARRLTVYRPDTFTVAAGGTEVPFYLTSRVPTVHGSLAGIPGDFIVDLGNSGDLMIHSEFAATTGIADSLHQLQSDGAVTLGGVGGEVAGRKAVTPQFSFGRITLHDVPVRLAAPSSGLSGSAELAGNIGLAVLSQFRLLFDYAHSRLIVYRQIAK